MQDILQLLRTGSALFLMFTALTGIAYPIAVTAAAKLAFPWRAGGSIIGPDGAPSTANTGSGSALLGQQFDQPGYFWGRLSSTSERPYNAAASAGSNLGPLNPALQQAVADRISSLRAAGPLPQGPVPIDLVTASGSGLDPDISPEAALYQVPRVATARGVKPAELEALIERQTAPRTFGLLGEPRVNVMLLNIALDRLAEREPR